MNIPFFEFALYVLPSLCGLVLLFLPPKGKIFLRVKGGVAGVIAFLAIFLLRSSVRFFLCDAPMCSHEETYMNTEGGCGICIHSSAGQTVTQLLSTIQELRAIIDSVFLLWSFFGVFLAMALLYQCIIQSKQMIVQESHLHQKGRGLNSTPNP